MLKTKAEGVDQLFGASPLLPGLPRLASKLVPLQEAAKLYRRACQSTQQSVTEALLSEMNISIRVRALDASRIPASGPAVVIANHPFGLLDGAALSVVLTRVR